MGKLVTLLILACLACRALSGQWPWQLWAGSERAQQEARARTLLGLGMAATRVEITEAHRRLITRVHPDRGGTNEAVHEANAARDLLLARLERIEEKKA
jgi:hypothetical protein